MRTLVTLTALSMVTAGCDQLTATVSAGSVLTRTPDLANAENMDTALAAALPLGTIEVKEGVAVTVAVGERESSTSTAAPDPMLGARVQVGWDSQRVLLCELDDAGAEGTYFATNVAGQDCNRPALDYAEGSFYRSEIETGSALYTMSVEAPPPLEPDRVAFSPQLAVAADHFGAVLPSHTRNTSLTVDWSADTAATDRHAFVTLVRFRFVGTDALSTSSWQADHQPVWDSFPKTAGEMIDVVAAEPETSATIPQTAFDQDGVYIAVVTITEVSSDVSTNLFLGSSALAGAGTAFVFWVD